MKIFSHQNIQKITRKYLLIIQAEVPGVAREKTQKFNFEKNS